MLLDIPLIYQRTAHDCGSATFKIIEGFWGGRGRPPKADPLHGLSPDALEPAFRAAGYNVLAGELTTGALRSLTSQGWPVACLIRTDEDAGHWVVVRGVRYGRVHYVDPSAGLQSRTIAEWDVRWHDADRRGTVFRRYGLAVHC